MVNYYIIFPVNSNSNISKIPHYITVTYKITLSSNQLVKWYSVNPNIIYIYNFFSFVYKDPLTDYYYIFDFFIHFFYKHLTLILNF